MKKSLLLTTALVAFSGISVADANETVGTQLYVTGTEKVEANTVFSGLSRDIGGAITVAKKVGHLTIGNGTSFTNNQANFDGGAIGNYSGTIIAENVSFIKNKAQLKAEQDREQIGGGAISLGIDATLKVAKGYFEENSSGFNGGAIATRRTLQLDEINTSAKTHYMEISDSIFIKNSATGSVTDTAYAKETGGNGGAISNYFKTATITNSTFKNNSAENNGGAIYNAPLYDVIENKVQNTTGNIVINDSTFMNNAAGIAGGAIYNVGTVTLAGTNVFSGNTVNGTANDIHNDGTLTISGNLTLDGGITGDGSVDFKDGSKLTAILNQTIINANTVKIGDATLNLLVNDELEANKEYDFINASSISGAFSIENGMYNFVQKDGSISYEAKTAEEVAESLGATTSEASTIIAATSNTNSSNNAFNNIAKRLSTLAQEGDTSVASEAKKLGATDAPVTSGQETSMQSALFGVVSSELNGGVGAMARGRSSGDYMRKATAWIRGLFNKADHEKTNKSDGFNSNTYGVAMGVDSEVSRNTRLGLGYANAQTDLASAGRKTDIDTNTLFIYSKYKPSNWYMNSMLAYSWSEYDEKKSVLGGDASAKYDVDTIALQSMYGYEALYRGYKLTPEAGLRYMHINQDAYTNKLGSKVAKNSDDVLTLVAGVKVAKRVRLTPCYSVKPELSAAVTYDLFDAENSANVLLANGASYRVNGEKLNRLGFELGAKVTTKATQKLELSGGYMTRLREDYQDHTLMLDAKYSF